MPQYPWTPGLIAPDIGPAPDWSKQDLYTWQIIPNQGAKLVNASDQARQFAQRLEAAKVAGTNPDELFRQYLGEKLGLSGPQPQNLAGPMAQPRSLAVPIVPQIPQISQNPLSPLAQIKSLQTQPFSPAPTPTPVPTPAAAAPQPPMAAQNPTQIMQNAYNAMTPGFPSFPNYSNYKPSGPAQITPWKPNTRQQQRSYWQY